MAGSARAAPCQTDPHGLPLARCPRPARRDGRTDGCSTVPPTRGDRAPDGHEDSEAAPSPLLTISVGQRCGSIWGSCVAPGAPPGARLDPGLERGSGHCLCLAGAASPAPGQSSLRVYALHLLTASQHSSAIGVIRGVQMGPPHSRAHGAPHGFGFFSSSFSAPVWKSRSAIGPEARGWEMNQRGARPLLALNPGLCPPPPGGLTLGTAAPSPSHGHVPHSAPPRPLCWGRAPPCTYSRQALYCERIFSYVLSRMNFMEGFILFLFDYFYFLDLGLAESSAISSSRTIPPPKKKRKLAVYFSLKFIFRQNIKVPIIQFSSIKRTDFQHT